MINHIQKVKNVGCYEEFLFDPKCLSPFSAVNILYGNNGSGKTTFSNLLFLLSKHCKNKPQLLEDLFDKDSELEISSSTGKLTHKNILTTNLDLYVFNSKFVADHVYNGTTANIDAFSSEVKLTSPEIEKINLLIKVNFNRLTKLQNWTAQIEEKLEEIYKKYNKEFQTKVIGARLVGVKPSISHKEVGELKELKDRLGNLYKQYTRKSQESSTIEKLQHLQAKINSIVTVDLDGEKITSLLKRKVSSEAKGKIAKKIESFEKAVNDKKINNAIGDVNDWFRKGGRLLFVSKDLEGKCPLCDTDLSIQLNNVISEYSSYFSNTLIALFEEIDLSVSIMSNFLSENRLESNKIVANEIADMCSEIYGLDILPFSCDDILTEQLLASLKGLLELVIAKKQKTDDEIILSNDALAIIESYEAAVKNFKLDAKTKIEDEIRLLQGQTIEAVVKDIKATIKKLCSLELDSDINKVFQSKSKVNSDIALILEKRMKEINVFVEEKRVLKNLEVSKLNAESKYINIYLNTLGISNFSIDRQKDKISDNIIITYLKSGRQKSKLTHSLSEGEKTALAFAYFISKLRVEKIESGENGFENSIIVIDDPISSLDDNRLFQTANLVDSFLFYNKGASAGEIENLSHYPAQVFVLSHNITFIKYIHNAIKSNTKINDNLREFYLSASAPILKKLPSGLKNFTNTYIIKLNEVILFREKLLDYEIAKNYLPNCMRIVLETFLSFKLAMVNDSKDRLPGLSHLINCMIKEFQYVEDVEIDGINKDGIIKRMNHLKKIADHESHGSIYKAEEFSFISEEELRIFAKNTIQVLSYIDNLHFKKVKGHLVLK